MNEDSRGGTSELEDQEEDKMPFLKDSGFWFVWDPCGIVCAVITYMLILYGEFVVLAILAPPFPSLSTAISVLMFTALGGLAVISHLKAMLTDPVSVCGWG